MAKSRLLGFGGLLAVLALVGAAVLGTTKTTEAMPPSVFRVTIENMTEPPTPISPGALVGHCADDSFWAVGGHASGELELIAEVGDPTAAVAVSQDETAMGMTFSQERYQIGDVGPGASVSVDVVFEHGCKLSSAHMLVHSNDTFVGALNIDMWDPETHLPIPMVSAALMAYDAGTEENSEPGSGFDGGQPDPARGADNLDNGVATDEAISASTQWTGEQARITIEYISEDPASMKEDEDGDTLEAEDHGDDEEMMDDHDDSMSDDDSMMDDHDDSMSDDDSMMDDHDDSMSDDDSMMDDHDDSMSDDDSMMDDHDDSMSDDDSMMDDHDDSMSDDDSMMDDHDDSMSDDSLPTTGSGGLADTSSGLGAALTALLAVLSAVALGVGVVGIRRRSSQRS